MGCTQALCTHTHTHAHTHTQRERERERAPIVYYHMCRNFHGIKLLQLHNFEDFCSCEPNQILIFQFKMFQLDSCIHGFYVYYVSWTPHKGELLHCACEITNREDPYAVAVDILSKLRMNKMLESWVNAFKLTQNLLSFVLLKSCFATCTVR